MLVAEYHAGERKEGRQWVSSLWYESLFIYVLAVEQGPAAAMGLSLVVGIVMAEVLRKLGAEQVRKSGQMICI